MALMAQQTWTTNLAGKEWTRILRIRKCYKVWSTSKTYKTYNNKPMWALFDSKRISFLQPFQMHSAGREIRQLCLAALHQAQLPPNMQHLKLNLEVEDQAMWSKPPRCQGLLHFCMHSAFSTIHHGAHLEIKTSKRWLQTGHRIILVVYTILFYPILSYTISYYPRLSYTRLWLSCTILYYTMLYYTMLYHGIIYCTMIENILFCYHACHAVLHYIMSCCSFYYSILRYSILFLLVLVFFIL